MKTDETEDSSRFVRGNILPPLSYNCSPTSVQQFFNATKLFIPIAFIKNEWSLNLFKCLRQSVKTCWLVQTLL